MLSQLACFACSGTRGDAGCGGPRRAQRLDRGRRGHGSTGCLARHGCRRPWGNGHRRVRACSELSIVHGCAPFSDLAPGPMRVEGDEEIDSAVTTVLVIVALALTRL